MTNAQKGLLGNVLLGIAILLLMINLAGMTGLTPKRTSSRELNLVTIVLIIAGGALRRRARAAAAAGVDDKP